MKNIKRANSIRFGRSRIYISGGWKDVRVMGIQKEKSGTTTFKEDVQKCQSIQEVEKSLEPLLRNPLPLPWLSNPTVYLGFQQGMIALAEALIVDNSNKWWEVLRNVLVDLFGTPKVYRGTILVAGKEYDLVVYETEKIPNTDVSYDVVW